MSPAPAPAQLPRAARSEVRPVWEEDGHAPARVLGGAPMTDVGWGAIEVRHKTGLITFFGTDASSVDTRRTALARLFVAGEAHFVVYPREPPEHVVSVYAVRHEADEAICVFVGTAWRDDRMPSLLELLLAFKEWPPTAAVTCGIRWSTR